jgi:hypothetical protein
MPVEMYKAKKPIPDHEPPYGISLKNTIQRLESLRVSTIYSQTTLEVAVYWLKRLSEDNEDLRCELCESRTQGS